MAQFHRNPSAPRLLRRLPCRRCAACDRPLPFYAAECPFCGEGRRAVAPAIAIAAVAIAAAALAAPWPPSAALERFLLFMGTPRGAAAATVATVAAFAPGDPPMPGLPPRGRAAASIFLRTAMLACAAALAANSTTP